MQRLQERLLIEEEFEICSMLIRLSHTALDVVVIALPFVAMARASFLATTAGLRPR
jgi:hypothetical protein